MRGSSALAAELLNGDGSAIATALRQLEVREAELTAKLDDAEEKAVKPLTDSSCAMREVPG